MIKESGAYIKENQHFTVLYNPLSNKNIVVLDQKKNPFLIKKNDHEIYEALIKNDIITGSEDKKKKVFKTGSQLTFWIYMTNQCNFRCVYCFVEKEPVSMSLSTIEKIVPMIYKMAKKRRVNQLNIHFSGGEPLLVPEKILFLAEKLKKQFQNKKITLNLVVLTNGSLVTPAVAQKLKLHNIRATVSLDGLDEFHNKTRKFKDGGPTFNSVINGVNILKRYNLLVNVEIVVNDYNIGHLPKLARYLLRRKIFFTLGIFKRYCGSTTDFKSEQKKMAIFLKKTYRLIFNYYIQHNINRSPLIDNKLLDVVAFFQPRQYGCGAGQSYLTITSDGRLIFCPLFIDTPQRHTRRLSVDKIDKCKNCLWRYMCGGGCVAEKQLFFKQTNAPTSLCVLYKELIPFLIDLEARRIYLYRLVNQKKA